MLERGEQERRPFYACESCGLVYACHEEPDTCAFCGPELFTTVHPEELES